ncbi:hypothetical protein ERY430_41265 [Erythrobacter sp. EC-HK427]|nr:hypothetical protein ERY430_41265 [Erythrobacter sp. EC-HK427]
MPNIGSLCIRCQLCTLPRLARRTWPPILRLLYVGPPRPRCSGIGKLSARPSTIGDGPPPDPLSNPLRLKTIFMSPAFSNPPLPQADPVREPDALLANLRYSGVGPHINCRTIGGIFSWVKAIRCG